MTIMTTGRYRTSWCWDVLLYTSLLNSLFPCAGSFKVTVPAVHLVAARHHTVVLGCEFTPDPGHNLSNLVVTWQRQEDSRVVHSFYYLKDQLERQDSYYQNRTALFYTELGKGNASLRITDVRPGDAGRYQCMVSAHGGTDRAELQLDYGAFYTEPRLSISFSRTEVKMEYEAEGFPMPEVEWLGTQGQNLSHNTEIFERVDQEKGLLYLKSSCVAHTHALNVTFVLKNQLLNQDLQRHVSFSSDGGSSNGAVIVLAVICSLLCCFAVLLAWFYWHKKK
ncbi:V-set domain-containing T-cell activation inhibitor 1 [Salminus brasiliensis]|uniref:V-set domain-containing T-cell activation inhibitor 1 n=1 Tax=Salminus brasiliensis TaxID=930266 RepID=UPI003B83385C